MTVSSVPLPVGIELHVNPKMSRLKGVNIFDIYRRNTGPLGQREYLHAWLCESMGQWWYQTTTWTGLARSTKQEALQDWVVPFVINKLEA